jgi:hypothetical protein
MDNFNAKIIHGTINKMIHTITIKYVSIYAHAYFIVFLAPTNTSEIFDCASFTIFNERLLNPNPNRNIATYVSNVTTTLMIYVLPVCSEYQNILLIIWSTI